MLVPLVFVCSLLSRSNGPLPLVIARSAESRSQEDSSSTTGIARENNGVPVRQVEVGGEALSLDELGPIIINEDGTMRRIANWHLLTDQEKEHTQRKIAKRNKTRIEALQQLRATGDGERRQDSVEEEGETLLLPESAGGDCDEAPPPPSHGRGGCSGDSTWPPPESDSDEHFPPRSMF